MRKCQSCRKGEALWAWQPFGPDESLQSFTALGSHYRGFPVITICDECKGKVQSRHDVAFTYRKVPYLAAGALQKVLPCPF